VPRSDGGRAHDPPPRPTGARIARPTRPPTAHYAADDGLGVLGSRRSGSGVLGSRRVGFGTRVGFDGCRFGWRFGVRWGVRRGRRGVGLVGVVERASVMATDCNLVRVTWICPYGRPRARVVDPRPGAAGGHRAIVSWRGPGSRASLVPQGRRKCPDARGRERVGARVRAVLRCYRSVKKSTKTPSASTLRDPKRWREVVFMLCHGSVKLDGTGRNQDAIAVWPLDRAAALRGVSGEAPPSFLPGRPRGGGRAPSARGSRAREAL